MFSLERPKEVIWKFGVMVASRWPLTALPLYEVPFHESVLPVRVDAPGGGLELHAAHVPNQGRGGKAETLDAIYEQLAAPSPCPRILCGDLNAPQKEFADGSVMTFGQSIRVSGLPGVIRSKRDLDRAERNIFEGLSDLGFHDTSRTLHGYDVEASSWRHYRLDHIFTDAALPPQTCHYLDSVRADDISDHSALEATFSVP